MGGMGVGKTWNDLKLTKVSIATLHKYQQHLMLLVACVSVCDNQQRIRRCCCVLQRSVEAEIFRYRALNRPSPPPPPHRLADFHFFPEISRIFHPLGPLLQGSCVCALYTFLNSAQPASADWEIQVKKNLNLHLVVSTWADSSHFWPTLSCPLPRIFRTSRCVIALFHFHQTLHSLSWYLRSSILFSFPTTLYVVLLISSSAILYPNFLLLFATYLLP
jgi:hypothetical protein